MVVTVCDKEVLWARLQVGVWVQCMSYDQNQADDWPAFSRQCNFPNVKTTHSDHVIFNTYIVTLYASLLNSSGALVLLHFIYFTFKLNRVLKLGRLRR